MIPPDVANNLRPLSPDLHSATTATQTQPILPAQRIADILGNLAPGQRFFAEIQALLPNGSYRAIVAQRDITLALPFSAKAGDSIELELVETNGKLALAVVANKSSGGQGSLAEGSATTLSSAGKLIGDLLGSADKQGKPAPPAPLNGSRPLVDNMPATAAQLAPVLKQALTQSGMFYEAHQARWVAGELPTASLMQEPQGQHSQVRTITQAPSGVAPPSSPETPANPTLPGTGEAAAKSPNQNSSPEIARYQQQAMASLQGEKSGRGGGSPPPPGTLANASPASLPHDLAPLVQQQLDALATQTFAWQGQIWPGQQMYWEINDQQGKQSNSEDGIARQWQTRLKLTLPKLGGINASLLLLPGNQIEISLTVQEDQIETTLSSARQILQQQFADAGLNLANLTVKHEPSAD